jgi:hypothetical protein
MVAANGDFRPFSGISPDLPLREWRIAISWSPERQMSPLMATEPRLTLNHDR